MAQTHRMGEGTVTSMPLALEEAEMTGGTTEEGTTTAEMMGGSRITVGPNETATGTMTDKTTIETDQGTMIGAGVEIGVEIEVEIGEAIIGAIELRDHDGILGSFIKKGGSATTDE